jgi:hypothetical protein
MGNYYAKKIGRDARTGRFISIREARRRPGTTVVEIVKLRIRSGRVRGGWGR